MLAMNWVTRCIIIALTSGLLSGCAIGYNVDRPVLGSGGLNVNNLLYAPDKIEPGMKYPGVVLNHGGTDGVEFTTKGWARVMARKGYVVILPQFRGQGGSGGNSDFAGGEVDDDLAALEYLKGLGYVDDGRIGMVGYSLGGLVALLALERTGDIKAAVLVAPLSDPVAFFKDIWGAKRNGEQADLNNHLRTAEARSPYPGLDKISAPLLILHGGRDIRVRPEQSRRLFDAMKAEGKDVQLKIYPDMTHNLMWNARPMEDAILYLDERLRR